MFVLKRVREIGALHNTILKIIPADIQAERHKSEKKEIKNIEEKVLVGKDGRITIFQAFAPKKNPNFELYKYNPMTITVDTIKEWRDTRNREIDIFMQRHIKLRHEILGNDLATAHFVVFRDCKVKFKGSDIWIHKHPDEDECPELPNKFVRNLYLEAIDASNSLIRYEGLNNLIHLKQLKWLSFKNCIHVDDWFVDRLSGEFKETLEYLDLSNCTNLTKNCLSCFYRFKNLKILILQNVVKEKQFEFSCMLLEEAFPHMLIDHRNTT